MDVVAGAAPPKFSRLRLELPPVGVKVRYRQPTLKSGHQVLEISISAVDPEADLTRSSAQLLDVVIGCVSAVVWDYCRMETSRFVPTMLRFMLKRDWRTPLPKRAGSFKNTVDRHEKYEFLHSWSAVGHNKDKRRDTAPTRQAEADTRRDLIAAFMDVNCRCEEEVRVKPG